MILIDVYKGTLNQELAMIDDMYDQEFTLIDTSKNKLLLHLARKEREEYRLFYKAKLKKTKETKKALLKIKQGHKSLLENVNTLKTDKFKTVFKKFNDDIRSAKKTLESIK